MGELSRTFRRQTSVPLHVTIHLDELQTYPKLGQELLSCIAEYMCSTSESSPALCFSHSIIVHPVVTGTSSKNIKDDVTGYSNAKIKLTPFSWKQCLLFVQNKSKYFENVKNEARLRRMLKACGGLPRLIDFFVTWLNHHKGDGISLYFL